MTRIFGPTSFGPVGLDVAQARDVWASDATDAARVQAAIELAKEGDLSVREGLLAMLLTGIEDEDVHLDAQLLLLSTIAATSVTDEALLTYATRLSGRLLATFAGSGQSVLARDAVPLYLGLAQMLDHDPDMRARTTDSVMALTGVVFDEFDEDATIQAYGAEAMDIVGGLDASYVSEGSPFLPAPTAKLVTSMAMRSHDRAKPFVGTFALQLLATWSGIPNPVLAGRVASESDVRAIVDYALTLSRLPWRPGAKYFYGHDVDGGPGLHDAAA